MDSASKAIKCLMEETPSSDNLHSGVNDSTVRHEFNGNEPALNEISFNRNIHKTRLCTDKNVVISGNLALPFP